MKFFVPCLPVAQPRPRATSAGGFVRLYEAKKTHSIHVFKAMVKFAWKQSGEQKLDGPIVATLEFVFERPTKVAKKLGSGRLDKPKKPDLDNLSKGVLDSLNGLAYHDDGQVVLLIASKHYAAECETPGVTITLTMKDKNG